jgi:hypothetical protein
MFGAVHNPAESRLFSGAAVPAAAIGDIPVFGVCAACRLPMQRRSPVASDGLTVWLVAAYRPSSTRRTRKASSCSA